MIRYKSTRGHRNQFTFTEAILKGLADDGGLLVPEKIPRLSLKQLKLLAGRSYQNRAAFIFNLFAPNLSKAVIKKIVNQAYGTNFDTPAIAPLRRLKGNQYLLELWHGPTAAFKDMALQIMPLLFSAAIKQAGSKLHYLILTATSGDTGKAALEGFKDKPNISIAVFYPDKHVSPLQKLQMATQAGANVAVYAVQGDFDAAQRLVKDIFNDTEFSKTLIDRHQTVLSSANSINWGRLLPQIIYHVSAYADLLKQDVITLGDKIDIAVPTGNFGNILAAFYTKQMGLPVGQLICASNANNVLTDFLRTGIYDVSQRSLVSTPSPSMDIIVASNIERLLYLLSGDTKKVSAWMKDLKTKGRFEVDDSVKAALRREFWADWVSNKDCLSNIKKVYKQSKYIMDPHTAVAQLVAERYIKQNSAARAMVICGTAHWAKFPKNVRAPQAFIPKSIRSLKNKKIIHRQKCAPDKKSAENLLLRPPGLFG